MQLTIACGDYDRTRRLIDGRIGIAGVEPRFIDRPLEELFTLAFTTAEFDVTELSFSRYILNTAQNACAYVALPIFPSRLFRHASVYIRTDRGIAEPAALRGRLVGVREYSNTASLVVRGMLEDEYGLGAREMRWRVGDVDHAERAQIPVPALPDGFDVQAVKKGMLLSDMLAAGEIDALVDYQPPRCFVDGHPAVARLFPDPAAAAEAYFRRSGIFPIMHVIGVRRSILDREPWLAQSLYNAFAKAKEGALDDLWSPGALKISLPFVSEELVRTRAIMGQDFWPYGVASNVAAIEALTRYTYAQGLTDRRLKIEELFAPSLLGT